MITLQTLKHIDTLVSAEASQSDAGSDKVYEADEVNVCLASLRRLKPSLYRKLLGPKLTIIGSKVYNGSEVDETPGLRVSFACARAQLANVEKKIVQLRDVFRDGSIHPTVSRISAAFVPECDCIALQDEFVFFDTRVLSSSCRILIADDNIVELDDAAIANWLRFACEQVDSKLSLGTPNNEDVDHDSADEAPISADNDLTTAPVSPIHVIEVGAQSTGKVNKTDATTQREAIVDTEQKEQMQEPTAADTNNAREAVAIDTHQFAGTTNVKHRKNKFYL